jgi:hypothetical protein
METARTSETSVGIDLTTWQYIPEDFELHNYMVRILHINAYLGLFLAFEHILTIFMLKVHILGIC